MPEGYELRSVDNVSTFDSDNSVDQVITVNLRQTASSSGDGSSSGGIAGNQPGQTNSQTLSAPTGGTAQTTPWLSGGLLVGLGVIGLVSRNRIPLRTT